MGVGWIDQLANNTSQLWAIQSVDSSHNGVLKGGGETIILDDQQFHHVNAGTVYHGDWCGIPWYWQGLHFKAVELGNARSAVEFCTSIQEDGKNYIVFYDSATLRPLGRRSAPHDDFHTNLRIEESGVYIDVVNVDHSFEDLAQILEEGNHWYNVVMDDLAKLIKTVASLGGTVGGGSVRAGGDASARLKAVNGIVAGHLRDIRDRKGDSRRVPSDASGRIAVVFPDGYRMEGLSLPDATAIIQKLGSGKVDTGHAATRTTHTASVPVCRS